jgi:predicted nuclease with RNAse H fold
MSELALRALEAALIAARNQLIEALEDELVMLAARADVVGVAATLELESRANERALAVRRRELLAAAEQGRFG